MTISSRLLRMLAASTAAAAVSGAVSAQTEQGGATAQTQQEEDRAVAEIEEIVVTASRREQQLQDAPLAISVFDPEELAIGGLTTLEELANYTPGVNFSDGGSAALQTVTMRGVSQTLVSPTVAIYLDDIPLGGSGTFGEAASQAQDLVRVGGMERIEIAKGPQGTLFGASSMGGMIRYVTGDPSTARDLTGRFSVDFSQTKEGGHNHLANGYLDIPFVEDRLGLRVSGFFNENGGFIDRDLASVDGAAEDVNAWKVRGGSAKLVAHFSDRFTGNFVYLRSDTEFDGINSVDLAGPPFEPVAGPFLSLQSARKSTTSFEVFGGTFSYDFGWADLISTTSYQEVTFVTEQDQLVALGPLIELFAGTGPGSVEAAPFTQFVGTDRFIEEIRLSSKDTGSLEWLLGGFISLEDSDNTQLLVGEPIDFTLLDAAFPAELNEYALFGDITYYITERFDVTVGARISFTDSNVLLTDEVGLLIADLPETTDSNAVPTMMFNARYRPHENVSLYTRIARGFRPASANLPVLDEQGDPVAPPLIEEDTLWSFEGGAKGGLLDGRLLFDFAGWYLTWSNLQANVVVRGVGTGGNSDSDVSAFGFEGALTLRPLEGLSIGATFAFTDSELDDDETAAFGALAGEDMPGLSKWTWTLDGDYEFPIISDWSGFFGGGVRYIGDRRTGFEGGVGENGEIITPRTVNFPIDSYLLADFRAGISLKTVSGKEVTLSFYANNAFNNFAFTDGSAVPVVQGLFATAQVVQPRTLGAVIAASF